ncbi:MAG: hypothetical protein J0L92_20200 [Deltaproteobacteria bacterium]|nr:hypothetical protein [Deltaproteobacteria bacterium]
MNAVRGLTVGLFSSMLLASCGDGGTSEDAGRDARTTPGTDAPIAPGTDAPVATSDDAFTPSSGSAGCGMAAGMATGEWVETTLESGGVTRTYDVWLPTGYDPTRAYPVDYQFHGCNDNPERENNNVPMERESEGNAIHVRGRAVDRCWDTSAMGPDVAFFDALVIAIESRFCADPERRWATGYSGGAFMTHRLACVRGSMLRGVATIAGGQAGSMCTGNVAALLIHDRNDGTVGIAASEGARDALVSANGCDATAARTPTDHPPCEAYAGCDPETPVVWCETTMQDHSRQDGFAAPAFWDFLSTLP